MRSSQVEKGLSEKGTYLFFVKRVINCQTWEIRHRMIGVIESLLGFLGKQRGIKKIDLSPFLLFLMGFLLWGMNLSAAEEEPIICQGDKVEYYEVEKKVVGTGNVVIEYKDVRLTCHKVTVYNETRDAYAEGDVQLFQGNNVMGGEKVRYNFDTKKGEVLDFEGKFFPWYGRAERAEKIEEKTYIAKDGYITTCDLPKPHYRIEAKEVRIYLDDKIVMKHMVFYVGKVPLAYFPYYVYPLDDNRPRVTIIPGHSSDWGSYVLSAWRYYFNEGARGRLHIDYRERKNWAEGIDYDYITQNFGQGTARVYYTDERDKDKSGNLLKEWERYRGQLRHRWRMDKDTTATLEYHKLSDINVIKDYFYKEYEKDRAPDSYFSIIRTMPWYSLSLFSQKRVNRFFTKVERLPEIKLDVRKKRLGDTRFYYKGETALVNLNKKLANSEENSDIEANRLDACNEVSYVTKLPGWFNFIGFAPYAGTRQTYYSKNLDEERKNFIRGAYYGGWNMETRIYKIYPLEDIYAGVKVNRLRHLIIPGIKYEYVHEPTHPASDLGYFDRIDSLARKNTFTLSLENKLQTKRKEESVDLFSFLTKVDFYPRKEEGTKDFSDIMFDLYANPSSKFSLDADSRYDPYTRDFETVNTGLTTRGEKWSLRLGHRYLQNSSCQLTTYLTYDISPKWKIAAYERFDFKKMVSGEKKINEFDEREYVLTRDLHCWLADICYKRERSKGWEVWVIFRLKAFPEIPFELMRTSGGGGREGKR